MRIGRKYLIIICLVLAVGLLGVSGWAWWTKIFTDPERVFDDAIANNLKTSSVIRRIQQDDGQQKVDQVAYLSFNAPTITAQTSTILTQKGLQRQETTVVTETLATPTSDFVSYKDVRGAENTPGAENLKKLLGVWAKKDADPKTNEKATFLNESLFGIVPIGNLSAENQKHLIDLINERDVYKINKSERKVENHRSVYVYTVSVKPGDLIAVLAEYAKQIKAIDAEQYNPDDYKNAGPLPIQIVVDIASRNIVKVSYGGTNRAETYSGYNLYRSFDFPKETITVEELQKRLQSSDEKS